MHDFTHVSFFDLDRLFSKSARALRRRQKRQRNREEEKDDGDVGNRDRSRTPPRRMLGRTGRVTTGFGGFTSKVEQVERVVIVTGVPLTADEKLLFKHFSTCGAVLDVMVVYSRFDKPTGTVIVEFLDEEAVSRACAMPPPLNEILGKAVTVAKAAEQLKKSAPAPKRMMTRQEFTQQVLAGLKTGGAPQETGPNMRKLHIKNLRPVVTEEDMQGIFKPFGEFEEFKMGQQECWITFKSHTDAQDAMTSMQGFQLVGQELNITVLPWVAQEPAPAQKFTQDQDSSLNLTQDSDFGATGTGANLNNRLEIMKKLISSHSQQGVPTVVGLAVPTVGGAPAAPAAEVSATAANAANIPPTPKPGGAAAKTLLLQNMFTPSAVNLRKDPKFYEEIREDTHDECAKFGKVSHLTVDPRGSTGLIYVLYETPQQRQAAEMALNGRWFEGKKIIAQGIDDSIWQDLAAQAGPAAAAAAAAS